MAGGQCHWLVGWLRGGDDATNPSHGGRYVVLVVVGFGGFFGGKLANLHADFNDGLS